MYQNLGDIVKAVFTEKFIVVISYIKNQEKSQLSNLTLHLKDLEKEKQSKPSASIWKKSLAWNKTK